MANNVAFFIVEDEENTVRLLTSIINKVFTEVDVFSVNDGLSACQVLDRKKDPMIVILDINLPQVNGLQILKKYRNPDEPNDFYFIIITGSTDKEVNLKALQAGADDFLSKPFSVDDIVSKLRSAHRNISLKLDIKMHLEKAKELELHLNADAERMRKTLQKFQEIRINNCAQIVDRIIQASVWIASQDPNISTKELTDIGNAASLCFVGRLGLPENLISTPVMVNGFISIQEMHNIPKYVNDFLDKVRGYEDVRKILYYIYENYDGTGIPENLKSVQIPLGSRILRVLLDFEDLLLKNSKNQNKVMELLEHESHHVYDLFIVAYLDQYFGMLSSKGKSPSEVIVEKKDLDSTMVIARSLFTQTGLKLVTPGTRMTEEKIDKIRTITREDPIFGKIFIKKF
ncbi:MAG: response regulator [Candidatus Kapabacteria bacterium]|nr:response regulator [Candidatus Kapabacteria bacterium]